MICGKSADELNICRSVESPLSVWGRPGELREERGKQRYADHGRWGWGQHGWREWKSYLPRLLLSNPSDSFSGSPMSGLPRNRSWCSVCFPTYIVLGAGLCLLWQRLPIEVDESTILFDPFAPHPQIPFLAYCCIAQLLWLDGGSARFPRQGKDSPVLGGADSGAC